MTSSVDEDLLKILKNRSIKLDARLQGWEYVLSLTGSDEGIKRLTSYEKYGPFLLSYLKEPGAEKESLNIAYKCLINLSSTMQGSKFLLSSDKDFISSLLQNICDASCDFTVARCYILSNLSHNCDLLEQEGILDCFLDVWHRELKGLFCSSERTVRSKYMFLSLVFSNLSRTPQGRKLLIEDESFLPTFLLGLNPEEPDTRRLGMALTIRNCCSEIGSHQKLLDDLNILPVLLLPFMGPEEYDEETMEELPVECQYLEETQEREKLPQVRKALIQALSMLCYTEDSWKRLKASGVCAVIVRLHTCESDPNVIEAIETLVGFLLVESYADPGLESVHSADASAVVIPAETDVVQDIPDLVL